MLTRYDLLLAKKGFLLEYQEAIVNKDKSQKDGKIEIQKLHQKSESSSRVQCLVLSFLYLKFILCEPPSFETIANWMEIFWWITTVWVTKLCATLVMS